MPRCRSPHLVMVALLFAGCAGDSSAKESTIEDLPIFDAVEVRRIGSVTDPELGFSRLVSAHVDGAGNVYALDAVDNQIRVYDEAGTQLRRIGRRGGGPGEFEDTPFFGIKGDTLWAYDHTPGRITFFDLQGNVTATGRTTGLQIPVRSGWGYVTPHTMRSDGTFLGWFTRVGYSRSNPAPEVKGDVPIPRVVFDVTGAVIDTVGTMPTAPPRMVPPENYAGGRYESVTVGTERFSVPQPPTSLPQWLPLSDGYIIVDVPPASAEGAGEFTVMRLGLQQDTVYRSVLRYSPAEYDEATLDRLAGEPPIVFVDGVRQEKKVGDLARREIRAKMNFPKYRLPVGYAWLANDGGVWLKRETAQMDTAQFVVLDPDGKARGIAQMPARARVLWNRGDVVWAAVPDEDDVPWLVRYELKKAAQ